MPATPRHPSEEFTSEFLGDCSGCRGGVVARDGMAMSSLRIGEPAPDEAGGRPVLRIDREAPTE